MFFYFTKLLVHTSSLTTLESFYIYTLSDKYCCCWNIYQRTILIISPSVYISINLYFCCSFHKATIICFSIEVKDIITRNFYFWNCVSTRYLGTSWINWCSTLMEYYDNLNKQRHLLSMVILYVNQVCCCQWGYYLMTMYRDVILIIVWWPCVSLHCTDISSEIRTAF